MHDTAFAAWCARLAFTSQTRAVIERIRCAQPSRAVESRYGNVSGRYPSAKLGVVTQFESYRVELVFLHELEWDENILEYYDQPPPIRLAYRSNSGRNLGVAHTPDFFVLASDWAGWVECKPETELHELAMKASERYVAVEPGRWRCPPGEAYAAHYGLQYRVWSSASIDWVRERNRLFLDDYRRAALAGALVPTQARHQVQQAVSAQLGVPLSHLLSHADGYTADDVYAMIVSGEIYVDLSAAPLAEPERVYVFAHAEIGRACQRLATEPDDVTVYPACTTYLSLVPGATLEWDGRVWTMLNVGEGFAVLHPQEGADLAIERERFDAWLRNGTIRVVRAAQPKPVNGRAVDGGVVAAGLHPEVARRLAEASPRDLAIANRRLEVIQAHLMGDGDRPLTTLAAAAPRTQRRWLRQWQQAKQGFGHGYVGLLPAISRRGNRTPKLATATRASMEDFIATKYETLKRMRKEEVYLLFIKQCEEQAIDPCSRKTFFQAIRRRPRARQVQKRQGARAAYPYEPTVYYLDQETPRHGDRPFEIGHIDHTEFDCELVCSKTGRNLGRPWATFLTDAYSRRLLATFVTFDPPSYRSCMMIVRDCVRRWGRLPERFVVDGGKEFGSVYFDMLVAVFELTKMRRPAAQPRFGSVIERLFGTTNTQFVHNLLGNTQSTRDLRTITTANDPRRQAVWTLAAFTRRLREWAYHVYDVRDHPALGQSPHDAYATGLSATGVRPSRTILYDHDFQLLTLPTTPKGHARVIPGRGVKIGCILYWCDAFRHPSVQGTAVPVRYDPFNAGLAYAYAQRVWRECRSEHLHAFRGRTERELQLASHELRRRLALVGRQQSLTSARLATFLESLEQEEEVLLQRLRAAEVRQALEEQAREAGFIAAGDNRPTDGLGQVVDADTPPFGPQDQLSSSRHEDASPDAESVSASRRRLADSAILPTYEQY